MSSSCLKRPSPRASSATRSPSVASAPTTFAAVARDAARAIGLTGPVDLDVRRRADGTPVVLRSTRASAPTARTHPRSSTPCWPSTSRFQEQQPDERSRLGLLRDEPADLRPRPLADRLLPPGARLRASPTPAAGVRRPAAAGDDHRPRIQRGASAGHVRRIHPRRRLPEQGADPRRRRVERRDAGGDALVRVAAERHRHREAQRRQGIGAQCRHRPRVGRGPHVRRR